LRSAALHWQPCSPGAYACAASKLRRPLPANRYFFITVRLRRRPATCSNIPKGRNNLAHRNAVGTRFPPHPARMARHPLPEERAVIRIRVPALSPAGGEGDRRSGEGVFVFPGFPIKSIGTSPPWATFFRPYGPAAGSAEVGAVRLPPRLL
jgi:hypothetical protein